MEMNFVKLNENTNITFIKNQICGLFEITPLSYPYCIQRDLPTKAQKLFWYIYFAW